MEVLREGRELIGDSDTYPDSRSNLNAARVQMHLDRGDLPVALEVAQANHFATPEAVVPWREQDQITSARALVANRKTREALTLLKALGRAAAGASRNGRLIVILNLEALAHRAEGRRSAAAAALRQSLALAAPEGFLRVFLDEGAAMRKLLAEIKPRLRQNLRSYVDRIMDAFSGDRLPPGQLRPGFTAGHTSKPRR